MLKCQVNVPPYLGVSGDTVLSAGAAIVVGAAGAVGLAKANKLAEARGVEITTEVADLAAYRHEIN